MERLTQDDFDYCLNECKHNQHCSFEEGYGLTCPDFKKYKKLAEYEDTGLEPLQIQAQSQNLGVVQHYDSSQEKEITPLKIK